MKAGPLPACSPVPRPVSRTYVVGSNQYVLNEWTGTVLAIQVALGELNIEERGVVAYSSLSKVRQC